MMRTMVKDEWVRAAMTDDSVVVELLVRLKQTQAVAPATSVSKSAMAALRWGIRQPRSRSSMRCDARGKEGDSTNTMRASPTTPLSWSGGGGAVSPSATTADAFEETSRHLISGVRSRVLVSYVQTAAFKTGELRLSLGIATNETTSNPTKRSRRKKTFGELKEEEISLLKERIHLKMEIETLRATLKEQGARNEDLKRMKVGLGLHSAKISSEISNEPQKAIPSLAQKRVTSSLEHIASTLPTHSVVDLPQTESCEAHRAVPARNSLCFLPDLNMMPSEDDSGSEILYGMS